MLHRLVALACLVLGAAACGGQSGTSQPASSMTPGTQHQLDATSSTLVDTTTAGARIQPCADVVDARYETDGGAFRFDVTVRSGDTGWDKYADAWEVRTLDGEVLGERVLLHPHETEQPFTRSLAGVIVPEDDDEVVIAARDSVNGYCGETVTMMIRP